MQGFLLLVLTLRFRGLETGPIETQLGISLSFPVENRNSLAWVLPTLSACPTYTGRRARLGRAWGHVIGRSASGASPGWCQGASHDFCAASLGLRICMGQTSGGCC